jgi:hypothetical protein
MKKSRLILILLVLTAGISIFYLWTKYESYQFFSNKSNIELHSIMLISLLGTYQEHYEMIPEDEEDLLTLFSEAENLQGFELNKQISSLGLRTKISADTLFIYSLGPDGDDDQLTFRYDPTNSSFFEFLFVDGDIFLGYVMLVKV